MSVLLYHMTQWPSRLTGSYRAPSGGHDPEQGACYRGAQGVWGRAETLYYNRETVHSALNL